MVRKVSAAPRRKAAPGAPPVQARELRGTKLSSPKRICNTAKWASVAPLFDRVCALKNRMSAHVVSRGTALLLDAYALKSEYKAFESKDLNAWECQALYHDIVGDYQRALAQTMKARPIKIQHSWSYATYKRAVTKVLNDGAKVTVHEVGDAKEGTFCLKMRTTALTRCANYLMRVDTATFEPRLLPDKEEGPSPLKLDLLRLQAKPELWSRLLALIYTRQQRIVGRLRQVKYVTGTFRANPRESGTKVVVDDSNKDYKLFLKLRLGTGSSKTFVYLPLLFNKSRLKTIAAGDVSSLGFEKEFRLKFEAHKLHVCTVYEAPEPDFAPQNESLGLDLNTKRSFATDDFGTTYKLDDLVMAAGLALLKRIDSEGGVSKMGYRRAAQLRQWLRRNEAHVKKLLAMWCDEWILLGITDVWLEDLSMSKDTTFLRHDVLDQKYSRILRLMRLAGVKDWLFSIGEKRGVRVHTTNAAYTSQECQRCHHIERSNRPTQALFHCVECHFECDADEGAAQNIKARSHEPLRTLLHEKDRFGRCSPKPMQRSALKALLMAQAPGALVSAGGVTDLPTPASTTKAGLPCAGSSGSSIQAA